MTPMAAFLVGSFQHELHLLTSLVCYTVVLVIMATISYSLCLLVVIALVSGQVQCQSEDPSVAFAEPKLVTLIEEESYQDDIVNQPQPEGVTVSTKVIVKDALGVERIRPSQPGVEPHLKVLSFSSPKSKSSSSSWKPKSKGRKFKPPKPADTVAPTAKPKREAKEFHSFPAIPSSNTEDDKLLSEIEVGLNNFGLPEFLPLNTKEVSKRLAQLAAANPRRRLKKIKVVRKKSKKLDVVAPITTAQPTGLPEVVSVEHVVHLGPVTASTPVVEAAPTPLTVAQPVIPAPAKPVVPVPRHQPQVPVHHQPILAQPSLLLSHASPSPQPLTPSPTPIPLARQPTPIPVARPIQPLTLQPRIAPAPRPVSNILVPTAAIPAAAVAANAHPVPLSAPHPVIGKVGPTISPHPIKVTVDTASFDTASGLLRQSDDRRFNYGYSTHDGYQRQEEGFLKGVDTETPIQVIKGSYSYIGTDGEVYKVNYIADENGFRAAGPHLPTPYLNV